MTRTHRSRVFASGSANTLYLTIPAAVTSDSQFPFAADDDVTVSIDDGRLVVRHTDDGEDP